MLNLNFQVKEGGMDAQLILDCFKPEWVRPVKNSLEELTGMVFVIRQDGGLCSDSCIAMGTRYIQFFNFPSESLKLVKAHYPQALEKAKNSTQ